MRQRWMWLCVGLALGMAGGDWPQWRGPSLDGASPARPLPGTWTTTRPVVWRTSLPGGGYSTPIIAGGRVFLTAADAKTNDLLAVGLDAADGTVRWRHVLGQNRRQGRNDMTSPSPVTDGKVVVFTFGTGIMAAFDPDGQALWKRDLVEEYGDLSLMFGYGASPLLNEGVVYLQVLRRPQPYRRGAPGTPPFPSFLLALDLKTGQTRWRHIRPTDADHESHDSYVTPTLFRRDGRTEIILLGGDYLTAHDVSDGSERWRWGLNPARRRDWRVVPTPVAFEDLLILALPRGQSLVAARPTAKGLTDGDLVWRMTRNAPDVCSPTLYGGRLYVLDGDRRVLSCLDPRSGRLVWQGTLGTGGIFRASPTAGDGKVFCINEDGRVFVVAAGDEFRILAEIDMGGSSVRSSVAIAAGRLFIRTHDTLYCVGER